MYSDVPNLASSFGYTNASWTLKSDLVAGYVCRLLNHMDAGKFDVATPRQRDAKIAKQPALDFCPGYILRAMDQIPSKAPKLLGASTRTTPSTSFNSASPGSMTAPWSSPKVKPHSPNA